MIKVKFFNMHMNRSNNPNDFQSLSEDKAYMESFNYGYTKEHNYIWKDIQLTCDDDYDYAAIIDCMFTQNYFDPSKTILFRMEPKLLRDWFGQAYSQVIKPEQFLKVFDFNMLWGWLGIGDYNNLYENFTKTKVLSTITSANNSTYGHINRLKFLPHLDSLSYCDIYGDERGRPGFFDGLKNYKGKVESKKEGLCDYKYSFAGENSYEENYFSEKLIDCILAECFTFYSGCLNLDDYIDSRAFIKLDLNDPEKTLHIIKTSIENNEWEKRIDIIRQEKIKVLEELNILNLVYNTVHGYKNYFEK